MMAIIKELDDIKRMQEAIENTDSEYLKRDYKKAIKRKRNEIKEFCKFRGLNYYDLP